MSVPLIQFGILLRTYPGAPIPRKFLVAKLCSVCFTWQPHDIKSFYKHSAGAGIPIKVPSEKKLRTAWAYDSECLCSCCRNKQSATSLQKNSNGLSSDGTVQQMREQYGVAGVESLGRNDRLLLAFCTKIVKNSWQNASAKRIKSGLAAAIAYYQEGDVASLVTLNKLGSANSDYGLASFAPPIPKAAILDTKKFEQFLLDAPWWEGVTFSDLVVRVGSTDIQLKRGKTAGHLDTDRECHFIRGSVVDRSTKKKRCTVLEHYRDWLDSRREEDGTK